MAEPRLRKRAKQFGAVRRTADILASEVKVEDETMTEWEYLLSRICVGSSLEQEAERLAIPPDSLRAYIWNKKFPERREEYSEARAMSAEAFEDGLTAKALEMLTDGYIDESGVKQPWTRDMVNARDRGLHHLYNRLKYRNRDQYGDKSETTLKHDLSDELRRRLEQASQMSKERARLEHQPGPIIDAQWTEVKSPSEV